MMPSYVNIGARVGADTMVDTWATVGSCAQIGEQRAPLRRRRHRRRARAAAGRAGDRRRRLHHRQPLHRRRGRARRRRRRARRRAASSPGRSRSSTPRPARSWAGASCRRGASAVAGDPAARRSRAASSGCRACWSSSASIEGERHDKAQAQRRSCATTARHVTEPVRVDVDAADLLALTAALVDIPVGEPRRGGARRPHRGTSSAARRGSSVDRVGDNVVARTELGRDRRGSCSPGTPTPCRPTATSGPGSTATCCAASARPT